MPPSRSAAAASTRSAAARSAAPRPGAAPRRLARRRPHARVRWDRVGRVALLLVLIVVAGLYVQHALSYLKARSQYNHQGAVVRGLQRANAQLVQQKRSLRDPATILLYARRLGMVRPGERAYEITGLPNREWSLPEVRSHREARLGDAQRGRRSRRVAALREDPRTKLGAAWPDSNASVFAGAATSHRGPGGAERDGPHTAPRPVRRRAWSRGRAGTRKKATAT